LLLTDLLLSVFQFCLPLAIKILNNGQMIMIKKLILNDYTGNMLLTISTVGIILSLILLYFNARHFSSAFYLGFFFLTISLYSIIQYFLLYSQSAFMVSIVFIHAGFMPYLTGPLLFFYIRSVLTGSTRLKITDSWHLLPMLIFLVTSLPYIFISFSDKMQIAARIVGNSEYLTTCEATVLYKIIPASFIFLSRPVLALAYVLWSSGMFVRFIIGKHKTSELVSIPRLTIQWLSVLLGLVLLLNVSYILQIIESIANQSLNLFFTFNTLQVLSGIGLTGLLILPFFFPDILYGFHWTTGKETVLQVAEPAKQEAAPGEAKKNPVFEPEYLHFIEKKTYACMK
jgi:hypothetical protein